LRPITVLAVLLSSILAASCDGDTSVTEATSAPVAVSAYTLKPETLSPVTTYASRIQAFEDAALVARIEARVLQRHVEGGERVTRGTPLIGLDPTDASLDVAQAEALVATARAELAEATRNFERGNNLSESGAIAAIEMDALTTKLESARAELQAAEAELDRSRVALGYTTVTAPIDGTVGLVNVSVGDLVGPDTGPLVTITRQDTVLVDINVGEADALTYAQRFAAGEEPELDFVLELPNGTTYDHPGTLFSTDNSADPATGTVTARIAYPNPDGLLLAGQSVTVLLSERSAEGRLAVPQVAVQQDQRGPFVMVIGNDMQVSRRHLSLGAQVRDWWLVDDGIAAGETVVTQGLQKIGDGSTVIVTNSE